MALPFPRTSGTDIIAANYNQALTGLKARIEAEETRRLGGLGISFTYTDNIAVGTTHTVYNWIVPAGVTSLTINYCISGAGGNGGHGNLLAGGFPCSTGAQGGTGAAFIDKVLTMGVHYDPGDVLQISVGRRGRRGFGYLFPAASFTWPSGEGTGWNCGGCGEAGTYTEVANTTKAIILLRATGGGGGGSPFRWGFQFGFTPCCAPVESDLVTGINGQQVAGPGGRADGTGGSIVNVAGGINQNGTAGNGTFAYDNSVYNRINIAGLSGGFENYGFTGSTGSPCGLHGNPGGNGLVRLSYAASLSVSLTDVIAEETDVSKTIFDEYKTAIINLNVNNISLGSLTSTVVNVGDTITPTHINALDAAISALEAEVF